MTRILSFLKSSLISLIPMKAEYVSIALLWIASLFLVYDYFDDKYDREIERLQSEAEYTLRVETDKLLEKERHVREELSKLQEEHNKTKTELSALNSKYRTAIRNAGGLRDKGIRESGDSTKGKNSSATGNNETDSRILSRETTEFLLNLTLEADILRERLRLCQDWARMISK